MLARRMIRRAFCFRPPGKTFRKTFYISFSKGHTLRYTVLEDAIMRADLPERLPGPINVDTRQIFIVRVSRRSYRKEHSMFHFWHTNIMLPQANTEPALYAVAFTEESILSSGGKCPQGLYPASPLSASECVRAKQGLGSAEIRVRELTGTVASVMLGGRTSTPSMNQTTSSMHGNPIGAHAGGTGSVAYLPAGMSLRGNDGGRYVRGNQKEASATGATARRSASTLAEQGKSYQNGCLLLQG
jgi:hypothetical protein